MSKVRGASGSSRVPRRSVRSVYADRIEIWARTGCRVSCCKTGSSLTADPRIRISAVAPAEKDTEGGVGLSAFMFRVELIDLDDPDGFEILWFLDEFLGGPVPRGRSVVVTRELGPSVNALAGTVEFQSGEAPGEPLVARFIVDDLLAPPGSTLEPLFVSAWVPNGDRVPTAQISGRGC